MKRKLAIVLCVALLLASFGVMNASAATTPTLSLSTTDTQFHRGDIVSVDVTLSGEAGSGNAGIDAFMGEIVFDPLFFSVTKASVDTDGLSWLDSASYTSGTLFPNTGGTLDLCLPSAGHVVALFLSDLNEAKTASLPITTDSRLFTINFTVVADAAFTSTSFTWANAIDACDPTSESITVDQSAPLAVTIVDAAPQAPIVAGVVDGKTYLTDRTITFDYGTATLSKTIIKTGVWGTATGVAGAATAFTSGTVVNTDGRYKLVVTGDQSLTTTIVFSLYKGYIKGISVAYVPALSVATKVSDLLARISVEPGQTVTVYTKTGTLAATTALVTTNMVVKVFNGAAEVSAQAVCVVGDLNGDGSINVGDMTQMKLQMGNKFYATGAKFDACDTNRDGSVNVGDMTRLKYNNAISAQGIIYQY